MHDASQVRWEMLCGVGGNPLTVAATRSVACFHKTLEEVKVKIAVRNLGIIEG